MLHFFSFLRYFSIFCWISLNLRYVKVDEGLLRDVIIFMAILGTICYGTPNVNTQLYANFKKKFQVFFLIFFSIFEFSQALVTKNFHLRQAIACFL